MPNPGIGPTYDAGCSIGVMVGGTGGSLPGDQLPCWQADRPPSFVHTRVKAPDPIRTPKLSILGPAQYYGGGPRGNRR